ncbi:glycosyltransferase family A protein [Nodularia harveyana UHCC-0300]|uniref:Glycosyltransferase family A protein n=1 Tax=Nodularia harveyana UHCC-0300 TaxID=2974287 RepID=A0ABU5U9P4_9CYAN|nr:glycosyltransferase family A protein [Nodularia harveyana]MEA5580250.1 glycosyltransferase family A protein [Nodularia harveyana UHCC-0300]
MKISIGMLAYNESEEIASTLYSLFDQSIFQDAKGDREIEIVVVANGCTDDTAAIAQTTLQEWKKSSSNGSISWRICEVEEAGKPNAWNLYVHNFSHPDAVYLFLMDADIQFLDAQTLDSMIQTLERTPDAWVSVDKLVKDIALKPQKNLLEKLSVAVSGVSGAKSAWICGQLYCGRSVILRKFWMPKGILVEDGFLWNMIVTNSLNSPEVTDRVVVADSASHVFEAYTQISSLLRHELRQVVGNTINQFIYTYLKEGENCQKDAGTLIKLRNEEDPRWLDKLIIRSVEKNGWWAIPNWLLMRRLQSLSNRPLQKAIWLFPVLIIAFIVDLILCLQANYHLHRWESITYQKKQLI